MNRIQETMTINGGIYMLFLMATSVVITAVIALIISAETSES
ncbi:hypothetical protein [Kurthia zopfii]|nr:hypothetical protein [Kurthia zopfii]